MKNSNNTEAELKKSVAYKKASISDNRNVCSLPGICDS